jgi:RNA polymerase sigma-B factor
MGFNGGASGTRELLDIWLETGNVAVRDQILSDHLPLVRRVCHRFSYIGEPVDDIVQVGTIGLLKAIKKYDPARGNSLVAFAIPVIVGEIKNYFRDHGWAVKMPRKLQRQKLAVDRAVEALTQGLGRPPTIPEIAHTTELTIEQVHETFEMERYGKPLSLDAQYQQDNSEDTSSILDYLGRIDPDLEALADNLDLECALQCVKPRERTIIYLRFYSGLSQADIAQRLGISQMHVSRLLRAALLQLRSTMNSQIVAD